MSQSHSFPPNRRAFALACVLTAPALAQQPPEVDAAPAPQGEATEAPGWQGEEPGTTDPSAPPSAVAPSEEATATPVAEIAPPAEPIAAAAPAPAPHEPEPPSPWPLTVTTSTFSRFEYREGYERLGVSRGRFVEGDMTVYRTRLGLRTNPLPVTEGVVASVQFTPQVSGQYGKTGTIAEQNLGLYEGYMRVQGSLVTLDVGRFAMNYGDAMMIGNLDWHQTGRSFEGARSRLALEHGWVDFFVTQTLRPNPLPGEALPEGHPTLNDPLFAGDTYFWGVYAGLGGYVAEKMDLDLYLLGLSNAKTRGLAVDPEDPTAGTFTRHSATDLTFGARVKNKLPELLDYRVEAGLQAGSRPNPADAGRTTRSSLAYQVDGEVGLSLAEPLRISLGGQIASGDDPETEKDEGWLDLYPTGHKFLGLMDVAGARSNIWSLIGKAQAKLAQTTTFNLDVHYFNRPHVAEPLEKHLGTELNAYLIHKFGAPLGARVLYGVFLPNEGHYGTNEAAHYGEAELALVF